MDARLGGTGEVQHRPAPADGGAVRPGAAGARRGARALADPASFLAQLAVSGTYAGRAGDARHLRKVMHFVVYDRAGG